MAEQLALDEVAGQRGAVDRHERASGAPAVQVDGARDELLARACFADDQHRRLAARGRLGPIRDGTHARGPADHPLEAVPCRDQPVEALDARAELGRLQNARDLLQHHLPGIGHRDEVLGTAADGLRRVLHRGVRAHHENRDVRPVFLDALNEIEGATVGSRIVQDDQAQGVTVTKRRQDGRLVVVTQRRTILRQQANEGVVQLSIAAGNQDARIGSGGVGQGCETWRLGAAQTSAKASAYNAGLARLCQPLATRGGGRSGHDLAPNRPPRPCTAPACRRAS